MKNGREVSTIFPPALMRSRVIMEKIAKKRTLLGVVTSDKMVKTRVVSVTRLKRHPKYPKYYRVTKKFKAHDAEGSSKVGDEVVIAETRPMSKEKRWVLVCKTSRRTVSEHGGADRQRASREP